MPDATTPPEVNPTGISQQEMESGKTMAILCYIPIAMVGLIVAIITVSQKNNGYSLYHAKQALTLYICALAVTLISVPLIFACGIGIITMWAAGLGSLVLCIMGIINASGGQCKPLPLIGQFVDKWFGKIQKV